MGYIRPLSRRQRQEVRSLISVEEAEENRYQRRRYVSREEFARFIRGTNRYLAGLEKRIAELESEQSSGPVKAILKIGGSTMPAEITIDTTDESATLEFVDRAGNKTAQPDNSTISFTSSDTTIANVSVDGSNPLKGNISPVGAAGDVQIGATSGGSAVEADGTPIPDPDPVTLTVNPGAAVGERLTLAETPAAPAQTPAPDAPAPDAPAPDAGSGPAPTV